MCGKYLHRWNMSPKRPVLFRSYDRPSSTDSLINVDAKVWEAARATSAAPTFFQPFNWPLKWPFDGCLGPQNKIHQFTDK